MLPLKSCARALTGLSPIQGKPNKPGDIGESGDIGGGTGSSAEIGLSGNGKKGGRIVSGGDPIPGSDGDGVGGGRSRTDGDHSLALIFDFCDRFSKWLFFGELSPSARNFKFKILI